MASKVKTELQPPPVGYKLIEVNLNQGILCFLMQKGNVLIQNLLSTQTADLRHEANELAVQPISLDYQIFRESNKQVPVF